MYASLERWHEVLCNFCDSASPVSHKTDFGLLKRKMNPLCIRTCCNIFEYEVTHFSLRKTVCVLSFMLLSIEAIYYLEVFLFASKSLFPSSPRGSKLEDRDQSMAVENEWWIPVCIVVDLIRSVYDNT